MSDTKPPVDWVKVAAGEVTRAASWNKPKDTDLVPAVTFRDWLKAQRRRQDPVGDLARDAVADLSCWHGKTWRGLGRHMRNEHAASEGALAALARARREWEDGQ